MLERLRKTTREKARSSLGDLAWFIITLVGLNVLSFLVGTGLFR